MQQAKITFNVRATGSDLHLSVVLNGEEIHALEPGPEIQKISINVNDDIEQDHSLCLIMSGKQMDHTKVDQQGQILEDRVIEITEVCMDDIELGQVFVQSARYTHDHNGNSAEITEPFYGTMGCNGRVDFCFHTPVYLWLLENM